MQKITLYILLSLLGISQTMAQSMALSLPQGTVKKTLPNGFTYIIMPNNNPKGRVEVRLCLKVGAAQEEKSEEGVAHFIEHLAFNGSKNYPNNTALKFWEQLGVKYGETLNAYTTDDRTVYSISLSNITDKEMIQTVAILADWLSNMSITPESVEKERKIILEEIASYTPYKDLNPIKVGNNPRFTRLPIATKEQVSKIDRETLLNFYRNYYLPKNATLIVVGDVATATVENAVKNYFKPIFTTKPYLFEPSLSPISFTNIPPLHIEKGKKEKLTLLYPQLYNGNNRTEILKDYIQKIIFEILKNRLKTAQKDVSISNYWYLQKLKFTEIEITSTNIKKDLYDTYAIIEGLRKSLTPDELTLSLNKIITEIRNIPTDKPSDDWAMNFIDAFIFNEHFIATQEEKEYFIQKLKSLSFSSWQNTCDTFPIQLPHYAFATSTPIAIYTTDKGNITYKEIQNTIEDAKKTPIIITLELTPEPINTVEIPQILKKEIPYNPSIIKEETYFQEIGIHRITLHNGATIYLKPTEKDSIINATLLFKGGYSLLPKKNFKRYEDMLQYIHLGGIETVKGENYEETLYQNNLTFLIGTEDYHHLAMATAPLDKSRELCNLIYQKLQFPEYAIQAFEEVKSDELQAFKQQKSLKKRNKEKEVDFKIENYKGATYPLTNIIKKEKDIQEMNLQDFFSYYKEYFISSDKLLCVITGKFDVNTLKKDIIGTLSQLKVKTTPPTISTKYSLTPSFKTFKQRQKGRTNFSIIYKARYEKSLKGVLTIKLIRDILRKEVITEIREKTGWVYTPYVEIDYHPLPIPTYALVVSGETDNKHFKKVEKKVIELINTIVVNKNVDEKILKDIKRSFIVTKATFLTDDNTYNWRNYLLDSFKNEATLEDLCNYERILQQIEFR